MTKKTQEIMTFQEALPEAKQYWNLFQTTGWNQRYNFSIQELESAIQNSWYAVSIYDSNDLIGFGRVIADGIHHALIVDMIIHPDHQGKGLGRKLLKKLVDKCKEKKIRDIQLFSAKDKYTFYEKNGFKNRPFNAPGMHLNDY